FLTEGSIKSNICFGLNDKSVDVKMIKKAINEAQLDEFVNQLPNGIDTNVGERGIQISGGQKQRIGLARALYNNPEVILMDEATSALDKETEKGILSTIKNLKGKKTIIMIAHNKDSLKNCDSIFELNSSKLIRLDSAT
ncbi:MAG: ATP-binding cassette domain-containing protein, partial [Flammeovirgaceae bacterium]